ncbi:MAG: type III pantothenate kinase [Bacteroidia bacterium]|nr:type III pantothenate kinase [Bacteroidia bacterium]
MQNLVIDSGNTRVKYGVFIDNALTSCGVFTHNELVEFIKLHSFDNILFSSVSNWKAINIPNNAKVIELSSQTPLPIAIHYQTPQTLGTDRIAAAVGAAAFYKSTPVLNIDTGTCIKYNYITNDACFLGGAISPGITMRYQALQHFTNRLPLLKPNYSYKQLVGQNTNDSLHSGVIMGVLAEIEQIVKQYKIIAPDLKIIVSGGDTDFLAEHFKNRIFAQPNLVLYGLHEILLYNLY